MADIVTIPSADDQLKEIIKMEREIGALQYKLKLVDALQKKGYSALIIADIWSIST